MSNRMDSRNSVLPQMLVVPLLCWILTGAAIAQPKYEGALSAETRTELYEKLIYAIKHSESTIS